MVNTCRESRVTLPYGKTKEATISRSRATPWMNIINCGGGFPFYFGGKKKCENLIARELRSGDGCEDKW